VKSELKTKKNGMSSVAAASEVGNLCYSDDFPPSMLEDDYFAIHRFSGI